MEEVFSVSQVNAYIKGIFLKNSVLSRIYMKGEVSNCKYHGSGHIYFTLKDEGGQIACVMFSSSRSGLSFRLSEGQEVIVFGSIQVYERDGKYQMYAKEIRREGIGQLYERLEQIKQKLDKEGLFRLEFKKKLPSYPKKIGIVTAATGAAVRDIVTIAKRRNPFVQLILAPSLVQGDGAAASVAASIHKLEKYGVDTIIVGRGGGSIEDLWAFNEEIVVRTIFECRVPVISAVGHETDTTLSDYVADLRAPTPSAAAELAVPEASAITSFLVDCHAELYRVMLYQIGRSQERAEYLLLKLQKNSPSNRMNQKRQWLLYQEERMGERIHQRLTKEKRRFYGMDDKLKELIRQKITRKQHQMAVAVEQLRRLSPLEKLSKGYSYVSNEQSHSIISVSQVKEGERLHIHVTDGEIITKVEERHGRKTHKTD